MTTAIFNLSQRGSSQPVCKTHVSFAPIQSTYLNPSQPPIKRVPFRQIRNVNFVQNVQVCMPTRIHQHLYGSHDASGEAINTSSIKQKAPRTASYFKVILSLRDILADHALRTSNFIMLAQPFPPSLSPSSSQSISSSPTTITINQGSLTITMPQHIYERTGLPSATRLNSGGRKHDKRSMQHRVNIDLRAPSMVKGRKGFDRLLWAASNVDGLREARMWLIAEVNETSDSQSDGKERKRGDEDLEGKGFSDTKRTESTPFSHSSTTAVETKPRNPLSAHHPTAITSRAAYSTLKSVLIPHCISDPSFLSTLTTPQTDASQNAHPPLLEDDIHDLTTYLSLLFLQSPIISQQSYGKIDPYLCRYRLSILGTQHGAHQPDDEQQEEVDAEAEIEDVTFTNWPIGLMSSDFVLGLVVDLIRRSRVGSGLAAQEATDGKGVWAALQVNAHRTEVSGAVDGYVILLQGGLSDAEGSGSVGEDIEEMDVDNPEGEAEGEEGETTAHGGAGTRKGFQYVTCFEFVDSQIH